MHSKLVVELDISSDAFTRLRNVLVITSVDLLFFHGSVETLDVWVFFGSAGSGHADDATDKEPDVSSSGIGCSLVAMVNFGPSVCKSLLQGSRCELGIVCKANPPSEDASGEQVLYEGQVGRPAGDLEIGRVRAWFGRTISSSNMRFG